MSVIPLFSGKRKPPRVTYTVTITQGYDGYLAVEVSGVGDDGEDRRRTAEALRAAADLIENSISILISEPPDAS